MQDKATSLCLAPFHNPKETVIKHKNPPTKSFKGKNLKKTESTYSVKEKSRNIDDIENNTSDIPGRNIKCTTPSAYISKQKGEKANSESTEGQLVKNPSENHTTRGEKSENTGSSKLARLILPFIKKQIDFNPKHRKYLESEIKKHKKEITSLKKQKTENTPNNITIKIKKETLTKLKQKLQDLEKNTENLQKFLLDFSISLRKLHKYSQQTTEDIIKKIDKKTEIVLPSLIMDSPTGPSIEVIDLKLKLKPIRFEKQDSHQLSFVSIKNLTCKVKYSTEDNQTIESGLNIEDLEIQIKAEWSQVLHDYVCSTHLKSAIPNLIATLKNAPSYLPSELWVKTTHVGIEFHQNSAKVLATIALREFRNLNTYLDKLMEKLIALKLLFPVDIECNTLTVHGDIENLPLPETLSEGIFFNGKAHTKCTDLQVSLKCPAQETYPESDITAKSLTVTVTDISTVGDNKIRAIFPKELTVTGSGSLFHSDKDRVSVSPKLQISGRSDSEVRKDGQPEPLYWVTDAQMTGTSFTQFSNQPPSYGTEYTAHVVSSGTFSINMTVGPAEIKSLSLLMDKNLNGSINADQASVDLDQLLNTDLEQLLNTMGYKISVPWYAIPLFKNKQLNFSLTNPINQGKIDLNLLKLTKLEFTTNKNANIMDRFFSQYLNWFVCPLLKRHCKFSTGLQTSPQEGSLPTHGESVPFLGIKLGPFNTKTDLPIPANVIDPHTGSLSITGALRENGVLFVPQEHVELITAQLKIIKKGEPDAASSALQSLIQFSSESQATSQSETISLMAQQWPVDSTRALFGKDLLSKNMTDDLLTIIRLFSNYKDAQHTSLMLAKIIKQKVTPDVFQQLISDFAPQQLIDDPLALNLYSELTGDREAGL